MAKIPDRALVSRLVDAYDRIAEQSLGTGDSEFHEIEDQLFDAIVDTPYRAVIKTGASTWRTRMGFLKNSFSSIRLDRRIWTIPRS